MGTARVRPGPPRCWTWAPTGRRSRRAAGSCPTEEARKPTAAELEQQVRYAQCMRAHGIDYPDPSADGMQQLPGIPMDDTAAMQRFEEAARACDAASSPAPKR
ncbi:hypothetical protein [Dactylosporangium cerinum]